MVTKNVLRELDLLTQVSHPFIVNLWFSFQVKTLLFFGSSFMRKEWFFLMKIISRITLLTKQIQHCKQLIKDHFRMQNICIWLLTCYWVGICGIILTSKGDFVRTGIVYLRNSFFAGRWCQFLFELLEFLEQNCIFAKLLSPSNTFMVRILCIVM